MATSSSYDFSMAASDIMTDALELINVLEAGATINTNDSTTCLRTLNMMVKAWQAEGIGLWKNQLLTIFTQEDQYSYDIGPSSSDHCSPDGYKTGLSAASAAADKTLNVDSDDNISASDIIGIELDDGTVHWDIVDGTPASDVVTITTGLASAAAIDNHVYNYTNLSQRPVEIVEARRVLSSGNEIPLDIISREEYMALPTKSESGTVTQIYYDPLLTNGKLYTWQATADVQEYIKFTGRIPIEDFDAAANDPDFPQEWLLTLTYNLAVLVAPKFGKTLKTADMVAVMSVAMKEAAMGFDMENASVFFGVRRPRRTRGR